MMQSLAIRRQPSAVRPVWRGHSCPLPWTLVLVLVLVCSAIATAAFSQDKPVALRGGKLLTVSHGVIENGTVVMQGGKIAAVGATATVNIPTNAQVIDATGMTIYPGLIDSESNLDRKSTRLNSSHLGISY